MVDMKVRENVSLSELTTMRLGGPARFVADINSEDDVEMAYTFAEKNRLKVYILGGGSNTIGRDTGYDGLVLINRLNGINVVEKTTTSVVLKIGSGEILDDICEYTAKRGYTGLEAMSSIPGTIGGAAIQNSGAYGQEIAKVLESVEVFDINKKHFAALSKSEINYAYRQSIFNSTAKGRYFITAVRLKLKKGQISGPLYQSLQNYLDQNHLTDRSPRTIREAVAAIRAEKLPDPKFTPSTGSFFKNVTFSAAEAKKFRQKFPDAPIFKVGPALEVSGGWLIEQAGLKGQVLNGMKVSDQAALILINQSAANYADLDKARTAIVTAVQQKFGITLQQEPEEI
jgi:UDP-N-acetylmuramate dehydrogenase